MSSDIASAPARTSCDAFLGGRVRARQPVEGPRAAIDALFLAAAIPAVPGAGHGVLEAGIGSGVAALALAARVADVRVTGVEIQTPLCALARDNAALNGFSDRITVVEADLTAPASRLREAGLAPESFDHVATNPPFLNASEARVSPHPAIAAAHAADDGTLEKWIRFLARMVRPRGTLTLIHRADALDPLLALLRPRFGALSVFPLFPREGRAANRVIVQGIKGSRAPIALMPGLVLHEADGRYTAAAEAVLKEGEALPVTPP
jgi:tRNA1(Val) A37 N6-methylase TrmN6